MRSRGGGEYGHTSMFRQKDRQGQSSTGSEDACGHVQYSGNWSSNFGPIQVHIKTQSNSVSIMSSLRNNPVAAHLKQASCLKRDQFNFVALVWTRTPRFLFISYISRAFLDEWRSDVLKDGVDSVHLHFISFIFCTLPFSI